MNSNNSNSKENSEVKRNAQMQENTSSSVIAAIRMGYNGHEKHIDAWGFEKEFLTEKVNLAKEISIQAFDSGEKILPPSISNKIRANTIRRMTETAIEVRRREKQKDNTMQK